MCLFGAAQYKQHCWFGCNNTRWCLKRVLVMLNPRIFLYNLVIMETHPPAQNLDLQHWYSVIKHLLVFQWDIAFAPMYLSPWAICTPRKFHVYQFTEWIPSLSSLYKLVYTSCCIGLILSENVRYFSFAKIPYKILHPFWRTMGQSHLAGPAFLRYLSPDREESLILLHPVNNVKDCSC